MISPTGSLTGNLIFIWYVDSTAWNMLSEGRPKIMLKEETTSMIKIWSSQLLLPSNFPWIREYYMTYRSNNIYCKPYYVSLNGLDLEVHIESPQAISILISTELHVSIKSRQHQNSPWSSWSLGHHCLVDRFPFHLPIQRRWQVHIPSSEAHVALLSNFPIVSLPTTSLIPGSWKYLGIEWGSSWSGLYQENNSPKYKKLIVITKA